MRANSLPSPEAAPVLVAAHTVSSKRRNGEYINDLDLPIGERQHFKHLKTQLEKHGHLLKHDVKGDYSLQYSISGNKGFFPQISLGLAEEFLKQRREMP
jgi:hypothetical protein